MIDTLSLLNVIDIVFNNATYFAFQTIGVDIGPEMAASQLLIGLGKCGGFVDLLAYLQINGLWTESTIKCSMLFK